jgi:pimeloyl-ACP methyl ester carboxylesterase
MTISNSLGEPREIRVTAGTIRYRERGTGKALVFIHGLAVNGDFWRKVVPELAKDFRCITPDFPLGGHSVPLEPNADLSLPGLAKLTVDILDELQLDSATLVGNDGGGGIAQMVAVEYPQRVARLVLNSAEVYELFFPPFFKPIRMGAAVPPLFWLAGQLLRFRPVQWAMGYGISVKQGLPDKAVMDSYLRSAREQSGVRRDVRKYLRAADPRYTLDAAERLTRFGKPVLLAWGAEDKLIPLDYARRLAEQLPTARLEVIADARTFVPEDQPKALADVIAAFVREPKAVTA